MPDAIAHAAPPPETDRIVNELWLERLRWSDAASAQQKRLRFWRKAQLGLAVAGAICATASATGLPEAALQVLATSWARIGELAPVSNQYVAAVGAVALALVGFLELQILTKNEIDAWVRARSVSEGIKSEIFRFRSGAVPYGDGNLARLTESCQAIVAKADELSRLLPPHTSARSAPPANLTPTGYLKERVEDQITNFYNPKADWNGRNAALYHNLALGGAALGVVISGLMTIGQAAKLGVWVPVLTTLSAAFVAYAAVGRYEYLAVAYARQAARLAGLTRSWSARPDRLDPAVWSEFVAQCEETISAENRAWMAEQVRDVQGVADIIAEVNSGGGH